MRAIDPKHDDGDPLVAWAHAQCAIWDRWVGGVRGTAAIPTADALLRAAGNVNAAISASAKATFTAQAGWARILAERVAGDPRSSKLVVEAAHQMYELVTAYTDAKTETVYTWLAIVRSLGPEPKATATIAATSGVARPSPDDRHVSPVSERLGKPHDEPAMRLASELMPPKDELGGG